MVPIVIANFAQNGCDSIQIFITMAVISQMAAAFGVFIKTKDKNLKTIALSAGITGIFGITEPAIYGVTLPRKKPFIFACICAGAGSVIASMFGTMNYVYAGLPGLISTVNAISDENPNSFIGCIIGAVVSTVGTIVLIMLFGYEGKSKQTQNEVSNTATKTDSDEEIVIYSPIQGEVKPLSEVDDSTFSDCVLGKGVAIVPTEGKLYAPFDGTVESVFETKHAIGLSNIHGVEVLIHIGLETVELKGQFFDAKVKDGDVVKKGDLLIEFNLEEIKKKYDIITPIVVTNTDNFGEIRVLHNHKNIISGDVILEIEK